MAARLISTVGSPSDERGKWTAIVRSWPSNHLKIDRTTWRGCGRTPRSRSDQTAIAARSSRDQGVYMVESPPIEQASIDERPGPRSWPNRGPIVARSRLKCMIFGGEIEADWLRNWSHDPRPRNRPLDAIKPPPQPRQLPTIFGPILSLNTHVLLPFFSTFDRFVKELSKFWGRSLVYHDPPAFKLNSEGIGAGLITNSSLISSKFPLEFWKSVGKDPSKFTPIRANWSLILMEIGLVVRFDRLSGGNLSFYLI